MPHWLIALYGKLPYWKISECDQMPAPQVRKKAAAKRAPSRRPVRSARLEARIPTEVHALLKRAAQMQGRSLSDFVVTAASEAAQQAIARMQVIRLSVEDQRLILDSILSPPEPTPALRRAAQWHRKLVRSSR